MAVGARQTDQQAYNQPSVSLGSARVRARRESRCGQLPGRSRAAETHAGFSLPGLLTSSNDGRTFGSRCQHSRMMSDSGGGQLGGMGGRSPFCTTPTAACSGVMSLYGIRAVSSSHSTMPKLQKGGVTGGTLATRAGSTQLVAGPEGQGRPRTTCTLLLLP